VCCSGIDFLGAMSTRIRNPSQKGIVSMVYGMSDIVSKEGEIQECDLHQ